MLGNQPATRTTTTSTTNVSGYWQIKGAYYTFRLGPMIRLPLTERLKISLGVGAALAYVGTEYIAQESVDLTDVTTPLGVTNVDTHNKMLPAYYADADANNGATEFDPDIEHNCVLIDNAVMDAGANIQEFNIKKLSAKPM